MKACIIILITIPYSLFTQTNWFTASPNPQTDLNAIIFFDESTGLVAGKSGIILKTIDGGLNWASIPSGSIKSINDLYFVNETTGYAVGDSGLILFSSNTGSNWIQRTSGSLENINSLAKTPSGDLLAVCSEGTILRSSDGGIAWNTQVIAGFKLNNIEVEDGNDFYICGDSNFVLKTTNAGVNWMRFAISEITSRRFYDVEFLNINTGFVSTNNRLYKTANGGLNWTEIPMFYSFDLTRIQFFNSSTGFATGKNSPIHKTTNGGINWHVTGPFNMYDFNVNTIDMTLLDSVKLFLCGTGGQILKSTNGGSSVTQLGGMTGSFINFSFHSSETGILTYVNSVLFTSDGGDRWKIESDGYNYWFEPMYISHGKVIFSSSANGYMIKKHQSQFGNSEFIMRTTNGGISFASLGSGNGNIVTDIAAIDNSVIAVGIVASAIKGIYRSDNGAAWVRQYTFLSNKWPLKVSFANSSTGVVCGYITGNPRQNIILRTTDSGISWDELNLANSNNIFSLEMIETGHGYLLCDSGKIFKSTDFGSSWYIHLGVNSYRFKSIDVLDETHAYAVTASNQLAFSSNGGANWTLHEVAGGTVLNTIQFVNSDVGYIAGENNIYKTTNGGLTFISSNNEILPNNYSLSQNYPNPFNPVTNIKFDLPKSGYVVIKIFDIQGREIIKLVNQQMQAGSYTVDWNATNYPSGVYFYTIESGDFTESRKMILLK